MKENKPNVWVTAWKTTGITYAGVLAGILGLVFARYRIPLIAAGVLVMLAGMLLHYRHARCPKCGAVVSPRLGTKRCLYCGWDLRLPYEEEGKHFP